MGSIGASNSANSKLQSWSSVYTNYRTEIENASELTINPENGHAYFSLSEGPITPIISDFLKGIAGTDEQIKRYFDEQYPHKMITIHRSKYI